MKKILFCLLVLTLYSCNKDDEPKEPDPPTEWGVIDLNEYYKNNEKPQ